MLGYSIIIKFSSISCNFPGIIQTSSLRIRLNPRDYLPKFPCMINFETNSFIQNVDSNSFSEDFNSKFTIYPNTTTIPAISNQQSNFPDASNSKYNSPMLSSSHCPEIDETPASVIDKKDENPINEYGGVSFNQVSAAQSAMAAELSNNSLLPQDSSSISENVLYEKCIGFLEYNFRKKTKTRISAIQTKKDLFFSR